MVKKMIRLFTAFLIILILASFVSSSPLIEEDIKNYNFLNSYSLEQNGADVYMAFYTSYGNEENILVTYHDYSYEEDLENELEDIENRLGAWATVTYRGHELYILKESLIKTLFWVHGDDLILLTGNNEAELFEMAEDYLERYPSDLEKEDPPTQPSPPDLIQPFTPDLDGANGDQGTQENTSATTNSLLTDTDINPVNDQESQVGDDEESFIISQSHNIPFKKSSIFLIVLFSVLIGVLILLIIGFVVSSIMNR